jgi:hypothetical protein
MRCATTNGLEHRLRTTGEDVARIVWEQLGDEARLDHDLGTRKELTGFGVVLAPKSDNCAWVAERFRQIRHRRDSNASCNEEWTVDVEVEAVSERAEDVDRVTRLERAERSRAGSDRIDEKRELTRRRLAEAHRAREHPSGCLEHEELTRHARLELSSFKAHERVRPDELGRGDARSLPPCVPPREPEKCGAHAISLLSSLSGPG